MHKPSYKQGVASNLTPAQFGFMNICTVSPDQREFKVVAPSTLVLNNQFPFTKGLFYNQIAIIKKKNQ